MNKQSIKKTISIFCNTLCALAIFAILSKPSHALVSSITIDAETGSVISSSSADTLRYPASLTKLMTLYITFDALEKGLITMNDELPVSRHAAGMAPSKLGLRAGEKIKVRDAVMAVVVKSANDCATVLAEGLGYSEQNFAKSMTKVAKELGMKNTTYRNASGLPNKDQKTTARDMAILGAAVYHHFPKYYKLFATKKFTYKGKTIYTHNHLLSTYAGADGMKTGFTNAAGFNIVTSAAKDGKRVIAVTMGHNTAKLRDKKVASLMTQGLKKLTTDTQFTASKINEPKVYASLEEPYEEVSYAQYAKETSQEENFEKPASKTNAPVTMPSQQITTNDWGIQIGAFSNYAKARNYALNIKKVVAKKSSGKTVDVEPYQKGAAIVYRSKIIGFAKNEATTACSKLKKTNKSCIVIAANKSEITLANKF